MTYRLSLPLIAALSFGTPSFAGPDMGAYLAAQQASFQGDFEAASQYFGMALLSDAGNTNLMESAVEAYLGAGEIGRAALLAERLHGNGIDNQLANLALVSDHVSKQDWGAVFDMFEAGHEVGPLLDGLTRAWAFVGQGRMDRALESFDEVAETPGLRSFGMYHKALALNLVGDLEGAEAIFSLPPNQGVPPTRGSVLTHVHILTELGDFDRAQEMMERAFGSETDPMVLAVRAAVDAGDVPVVDMVDSARHGVAFAMIGLTDVLIGEAEPRYLVHYSRAAQHITPDNSNAHIQAGSLLRAMEQYDLAAAAYARVDVADPRFHSAEIGRAEVLRTAGKYDAAIEVLTQLTRSHPDMPLGFASLGDAYLSADDYAAANTAYSKALSLYPEGATVRWWILYTRGMTHERLGEWPQAEADFRAALELNPDQPSVLNYLGYSLVDQGLKLEEAMGMIETAVAARPDSGAITDSLGWAYYKLGQFEEAVPHLERAAELEPNDPIISDHLGDAYWMVGREIEANFQWHRALSFEPEEDEAIRIRRKLQVGLEAVYAEEGSAPPAEVAYDSQ